MASTSNKDSLFIKSFSHPDNEHILILPQAWTLLGHRLPESAFLRNPYGDMWVVTVGYDDITKRYSFENGWNKFVECNKVEFEDLLVFKFNGISTFDFKLFGKNNEEKGYFRIANVKREEEELQPEEPEGLGRDKQLVIEPRPNKRKGRKRGEEARTKKRKVEKRASRITRADEDAIFQKACIPRPENPCFVTKPRLNKRNMMYIPTEVIKDYRLELPQELMIRDEKDREWSGPVRTWKDGRHWFTKGWPSYCGKNKVKVDDWCIIEIVQPETPGANMYLKARLVPATSIQ